MIFARSIKHFPGLILVLGTDLYKLTTNQAKMGTGEGGGGSKQHNPTTSMNPNKLHQAPAYTPPPPNSPTKIITNNTIVIIILLENIYIHSSIKYTQVLHNA